MSLENATLNLPTSISWSDAVTAIRVIIDNAEKGHFKTKHVIQLEKLRSLVIEKLESWVHQEA